MTHFIYSFGLRFLFVCFLARSLLAFSIFEIILLDFWLVFAEVQIESPGLTLMKPSCGVAHFVALQRPRSPAGQACRGIDETHTFCNDTSCMAIPASERRCGGGVAAVRRGSHLVPSLSESNDASVGSDSKHDYSLSQCVDSERAPALSPSEESEDSSLSRTWRPNSF